MLIVSTLARLVIGALAGLGSFLLLIPGFSALFMGEQPALVLGCGLFMVALGAAAGGYSGSIRRTAGWTCVALGLGTLSLPLTTMLLSGRLVAQQASSATAAGDSATMLGAGLGASLATGVAAIVGLFFGAILLVAAVALLRGRRDAILASPAAARLTQLSRVEPPLA